MILEQHPDVDYSDTVWWDKHWKAKVTGKRFLGYWKSRDEPNLPDPQDYVDAEWRLRNPVEWQAVWTYLQNGRVWESWRGTTYCRLHCPLSANLGTKCLTDGLFVWPEGFSHYVQVHNVKPPKEFIEHVSYPRHHVP